MKLRTQVLILNVLLIVGIPFACPAVGQNGGGLNSRAQNQVQQRVQTRVQTQVQQQVQSQVQNQVRNQLQSRVQDQVQNRVQGQVQQRIQSQVAGQVETRLSRQIQSTARQAASLAARAETRSQSGTPIDTAKALRANASFNANARSRNNANPSSRQDASGRSSASAASSIRVQAGIGPLVITPTELAAYDTIFGQFNPLRDSAVVSGVGQEHSLQVRSDNAQANRQSNTAASRNDMANRNGGKSDQRPGSAGVLAANVDLSAMISVAARQRSAEISQIRDQAIASADVEMLAQADMMEAQLKAFATAQQQAIEKASVTSASASEGSTNLR